MLNAICDMRLNVFVFVRCAPESQWDRLTQRYMMLFVLFSFSCEISVKNIHFSSNVSYSVYASYFSIWFVQSVDLHVRCHTFERNKKFFFFRWYSNASDFTREKIILVFGFFIWLGIEFFRWKSNYKRQIAICLVWWKHFDENIGFQQIKNSV